jgi:hypothetical protein
MLEILPAFGKLKISHQRAYDFDEKRGLWLYKIVDAQLDEEDYHNIITNAGRVGLHTYVYGTSSQRSSATPVVSNVGLNYIGLTNDSGAPAASDTSLASELSGNGLTRAQGTVTLPTGSGNQTTIAKTFTFTGASQAVQKTALFDDPSAGRMIHEIQFTQRTLLTNDTLTVTFTLTVG